MPSRRSVLRSAVGLAAGVGTAGCLARASDAPDYTAWLYDPRTVLDVGQHGFLSMDVPRFRANRDQLPGSWAETVERAGRQTRSVDLSDLSRTTAVGYGARDAASFGASIAVEGTFDPDTVVAEFTAGPDIEHHGTFAGYRLFSYAPAAFQRIRRLKPADGPAPSATFALAVRETRLVVGSVVDAEREGVEAVRAMVRARRDETARYADRYGAARTVLRSLRTGATPFGRPALVAGVVLDTWEEVAARIPDDWPTLRAIVDDLRAFGLGVSFARGTTVTDFVLVYDPEVIADPENVDALVEKFREEQTTRGSGIVDVRLSPDGRAVVVRTTVDLREIWADYRDLLSGWRSLL